MFRRVFGPITASGLLVEKAKEAQSTSLGVWVTGKPVRALKIQIYILQNAYLMIAAAQAGS